MEVYGKFVITKVNCLFFTIQVLLTSCHTCSKYSRQLNPLTPLLFLYSYSVFKRPSSFSFFFKEIVWLLHHLGSPVGTSWSKHQAHVQFRFNTNILLRWFLRWVCFFFFITLGKLVEGYIQKFLVLFLQLFCKLKITSKW